jgi:hypothetical protein
MNNGLYGLSRNVPTKVLASVVFNGADGSIYESYGVKSVTRNSAGNYTVELDFAMASTRWVWGGGCRRTVSGTPNFALLTMQDSDATNSTISLRTIGITTAPAVADFDPAEVSFFVIGAD